MHEDPSRQAGHHDQLAPPGPRLRSDVLDVYVFRRIARSEGIELLQLLRAESPMEGTWQPVMGHIEPGEHTVAAALRELNEEIRLLPSSPAFLNLWALEQVWPFYLPSRDAIMLSPRFVVEVAADFEPALNHEHKGFRWVGSEASASPLSMAAREMGRHFLWPGQRHVIAEIYDAILIQSGKRLLLDHRAAW